MKINLLMPVYNDWEALKLLLTRIQELYKNQFDEMQFVVVNDASNIPFAPKDFVDFNLKVIHLNCNLSHQRAIAVGLAYLANQELKSDYVVVMDSDGEDQPEHIALLIEKAIASESKIIFAQRKRRTESLAFKVFYFIYKAIFKTLTGHVITFGNFCVVPANMLKKLTFVSEIWNNFPGGAIRSKLPLDSLPLDRGRRLAGVSKMNFTSLILHGMSAISVFLDFTAVRILILILFLVGGTILGAGVVLYIKFILDQATPGWATTAIFAFLTVSLQCFLIALFILFMVLSSRRYTSFVPYLGYKMYIDHVE
jgi:polyisoprenyl-phosphate glycosyltransferase